MTTQAIYDVAVTAIQSALKLTDYNAKRNAMQRAFKPFFDAAFPPTRCALMHSTSYFISDGSITMPTPAPSNFSQRLHPDVIVWAMDQLRNKPSDRETWSRHVFDAFVDPARARFNKGKRTFGYPEGLTDEIVQKAYASMTTATLKGLALSTIVDTIDTVAAAGVGLAAIEAILRGSFPGADENVAITSALTLIGARGERTDAPTSIDTELHTLLTGSAGAKAEEIVDAKTARGMIPMPSAEHIAMIDGVMKIVGLPSVAELINATNAGVDKSVEAKLLAEIADLKARPAISYTPIVVAAHAGGLPAGKVELKKAADVFGATGTPKASLFDFDVPVGEWDHDHPHVPVLDPDYRFAPPTLVPMLLAILHGDKPWLRGHTGTGKTTLVEQVYARLNLPLYRVNLDSDITRSELVGRDTIKQDPATGSAVSAFSEGIIPRVMQEPCGFLLDEIDSMRPDLGFVLQRLTEGKGFMLLEDGGRTIMPHPWFRMFATANTNGRGDESGLYTGTRVLGSAFVNRWGPFLMVDYIDPKSEVGLVMAKSPGIKREDAERIVGYAKEHRIAFTQSQVTLPCSPRDTMQMGRTLMAYMRVFPEAEARKHTFDHVVANAADGDDMIVLRGLADRTLLKK